MHDSSSMTSGSDLHTFSDCPCRVNSTLTQQTQAGKATGTPSTPTLSTPPTPAEPSTTTIPIFRSRCEFAATGAPPSPPVPLLSPLPELELPQVYCDFTYHTGFLQGRFSDISVSFPAQDKTYAMHRIVLVRSPMLYRRLMTSSRVALEDGGGGGAMDVDILGTSEALHTALGHLYRPLTVHDLEYLLIHTHPSATVVQRVCDLMEVAHALELVPLRHQLAHITQQHLSQHTVLSWMDELTMRRQRQQQKQQSRTRRAATHHSHRSVSSNDGDQSSWIETADELVMHFLTHVLPCHLLQDCNGGSFRYGSSDNDTTHPTTMRLGSACVSIVHRQPFSSAAGGLSPLPPARNNDYDTLVQMYARMPLNYLKRCLEHKDLLSKDVLWRYTFANQVLAAREQGAAAADRKHSLSVSLEFHGVSAADGDIAGVRIVMRQRLAVNGPMRYTVC